VIEGARRLRQERANAEGQTKNQVKDAMLSGGDVRRTARVIACCSMRWVNVTAVPGIVTTEGRVRFLRLRQTIGVLLIGLVVYLSLTPHPIEIPIEQGDKYGHVLAYAALMFWYALMYLKRRDRMRLALGFVFMGVALEFLQGLTNYRTFEIGDMAGDSFGVIVGWLGAAGFWQAWSRHAPPP